MSNFNRASVREKAKKALKAFKKENQYMRDLSLSSWVKISKNVDRKLADTHTHTHIHTPECGHEMDSPANDISEFLEETTAASE